MKKHASNFQSGNIFHFFQKTLHSSFLNMFRINFWVNKEVLCVQQMVNWHSKRKIDLENVLKNIRNCW